MVRSRLGYRTVIPTITTQKGQTQDLSFKDGVNTYKDNDDLKNTELLAAVDARMVRIGRYRTRRGLDRFTVPIGETSTASVTAVTGAGVFQITSTQAIAQKFTAAASKRLTRADVRIRSTTQSKGVLLVEAYADASGMPGALIARSSIRPADITSTFSYVPSYFVESPLLVNGTSYWLVTRAQNDQAGTYEVSTTNSAATALTSATNGAAWTPAAFAANINVYTSNNGGVKGLFKAYRPNGQVRTLFAAGDTMYEANSDGTTTIIKSGLNPAATYYRFSMDQDTVRWVNGLEAPYKWDFTTVTQVTGVPVTPNNIMSHKGLVFYTNDADDTAANYSNFGLYDTFTATDLVYMPGPKNADGIRAMAPLNGVLYFFAKRNKLTLLGSSNDTFQQDEATSQRGTFSQESIVYDANYIYHADDEGVWQFNGSDEKNVAQDFLEEYKAITDKSSINLDVFGNRLYIWYAPAGASDNTECFVYNLTLGIYESKDKKTIVGRTFGRETQDDTFMQASNRVGAVYFAERSTNDYHNLGDQMQTSLETAFTHFDTPSQLKRIPKQRPQLPSVTGSYYVQAGYAKDFGQQVFVNGDGTARQINVAGDGIRYNTGVKYDTGARYAGSRMITPKNLYIPGTFNRLQRIYRHIAAREPFEFDSEVLTVQIQRID